MVNYLSYKIRPRGQHLSLSAIVVEFGDFIREHLLYFYVKNLIFSFIIFLEHFYFILSFHIYLFHFSCVIF